MKKTVSSLKNKKADFNSNQSQNKSDSQQLNILDLVKPNDFESIYFNNKNSISLDPNRVLVKIPDNDVKISKVDRKKTVYNNGVPPSIHEIFEVNIFAKLCIDFYTSQWTVTCYKDFSYNSTFWGLPNVYSQLTVPKEQKFLIDVDCDKDDDSLLTFKTKGIYFESKLTVCDRDDYQKHLKYREEELASNVSTSSMNHSRTPVPKLVPFSLSELSDGTKVLKESMPRDGHEQIILYLDAFNTPREIGGYWILLSFKGKQKESYLFTGGSDNQKLWFKHLKDAIDSDGSTKSNERTSLQDSSVGAEESAQGMLSKFLQENEQTAMAARKKDHQKLLLIYPDIRNQVKTKAQPTPFYDTGIIEKSLLHDEHIRTQIEQSVVRNFMKLTVNKFMTVVGIHDDTSSQKALIPPEPFFISFSLIHIGDGRRISEEFYWNPNKQQIEDLLPQELFNNRWHTGPIQSPGNGNKTPLDLHTLPNRILQNTNSFILKVPYGIEQVCLLVKAEKVFNGSMNSAVDKYVKSGGVLIRRKDKEDELTFESGDTKTGSSIFKSMSVYCANIGHYRMPFGWTVNRLSNKGVRTLKFYKYDGNKTSEEDLIKQVQSIMSSQNLDNSGSKYSSIPGIVEISLEETNEDIIKKMPNVVNSELVCKLNSDSSNQEKCCKEVKEFTYDTLKPTSIPSHIGNNIRNAFSTEICSTLPGSKSNSSYGSTASLQHYSDDNSPGDVTPPGKFNFSNSQIKSVSFMKSNSGSLGRINGVDTSYSKNPDISDQIPSYFTNINQEELITPNLDFCNTLYIYPRTLNYSNQNSFQRARNLSCFVELRDSDRPAESIPLKVFYARPSNKQPAFDSWANTCVIYHDSSPTFNEEMKISLPIKLNPKHHLLFRFHHVSCDTAAVPNVREKSSNKKPLETTVGFSWFPLIDQNYNLKSGSFNLPVAVNLVPDYLDEKIQTTSVQWVDGQKPIFNIVIRPETTIFTDNMHLQKFFQVSSQKIEDLTASISNEKKDSTPSKPRSGSDPITQKQVSDGSVPYYTSKDDVEIKNTIKALGTLNVTSLIKYFAPTFNQLLYVVVCTSQTHPDISKTAVSSMITLASSLRTPSMEKLSPKATKRNTKIIKSYIKFAFDGEKIVPQRIKRTVHESLVQTISELISPPFRDTIFVNSFLFNSFFFYSIITKSMSQSFDKQSKVNIDRRGDKLFSSNYMDILQNMIHLIINCIFEISSANTTHQSATNANPKSVNSHQNLAISSNKDLARFISRLLNVMDRGFIFQRIHQYMKLITVRINSHSQDREHLCKMKFDFLEIISMHEHFLPLNLMKIINPSDKAPPSLELILSETYCRQHYLAGLILQQVHQQMCDIYSTNSIRRLPFVILRNMLAKHIFDERYNGNINIQARIAALYLPFISIILENQKALCLPGHLHSKTNILKDIYEHSDRSISNRPLSAFSSDTVSTNSSTNGSSGEGAGGSVYGLGFGTQSGKPARNSQIYIGKNGQVEDHWLKQIAGLTEGGGLRTLSTRRHVDSDASSVHSTSTLTGLDEMHELGDSNSLDDELMSHSNTSANNELANKRSSLQRPAVSSTNSWGRKAGLSLNIKKASVPGQATQRLSGLSNKMSNKPPEAKSSIYLNDKTQKDLFVCLIHIFSTISPEDMKTAICKLTVQERLEFLQLLIYSIHHLKYQGKTVINNLESISNSGLNQIHLRTNGRRPSISGILDDLDHGDNKAFLEGNVSTEVGLVVLDVLTAYCTTFKQEILTYTPDHSIFKRIVDVYLTLLSVHQSETVLRHVFVSMRVFVSNFAKVLFANCHNVISELSLYTLRFLDTRFTPVRIEACGFLYRMMRCSYDTFNKPGINRVHLQMIVAVSKIDRTVGVRFNESLSYLKRLAELEMQKTQANPSNKPRVNLPSVPIKPKTIGVHSTTKLSMQSFFEEVSDLTQRIRTVLMATVQMNEHKDDHEMLVDLQYSLAKSYSSNPALRRTWLEKIYAIHEKNNSRAEMAMCKAHIVAMIAEYLKRKEHFTISSENFKLISPNIPREESGMRDDSVQLEVHYTKEEVVKLLRELAQEFDAAGLWEVLRYVYKLIIPIYEKKRDYEQLAEIYQHMASGYIKIRNSEATNQRIIGSYYRVVLYGKLFENMAGKVFIYRLDSGKQFCVVREELQKLFTKKYGCQKVQMIVENHVDRSKLDPEMASIQVTHVEPFFDEDEELEHHSMFEMQYNICKFMLETPFVKKTQNEADCVLKSKQTDDLSIQWKRRTILTVESSFPHLKRRLEVVSTKEIDFSPIERAIDEIKLKNRQLAMHVAFNKSTSKSSSSSGVSSSTSSVGAGQARVNNIPLLMDMHMSGALLPQVNQGPMAYARVFLQKENQVNYSQEKVKQLKIQFMEFLTLCHLLLRDYYDLMSHIQKQKYDAMQEALDNYRLELSNLVNEEVILDEEKGVISSSALADSVKTSLSRRGTAQDALGST